MSKHVVVIGAVALGPKVASRLKRCAPEMQITVLCKEKLFSYGGCGIPYYVGGDISDAKELRSTMYHMVRDEAFFLNVKHVDVLSGKEVVAIDRKNKKVIYKDLETAEQLEMDYDILVLGTGSTPVLPPIAGTELPGVYTISTLDQAIQIKEQLAKGEIESATIVGGGTIGIEMAEAFTDLWGIETTIVEMKDQLLPAALGPEMAKMVQKKLEENEIKVLTGTKVTQVIGDMETGVQTVETTQGNISCQLVLFCVGVSPNSSLASQAGLPVGPNQGILVDNHLRTTDPNIYAGGDCVEQIHQVSGEYVHFPMGSLANRQGRVIGTNIAGDSAKFKGVIGNFCLKVFDMGMARAGLTVEQARQSGFDPVYSVVVQSDKAHFYPDSALMYLKLIADKKTSRVLGIEAIGPNGDAVKARVDAVAALLPHEVGIEEISNLEVCYAPPLASAMDIVNTSANVLQNILDGLNHPVDLQEFLQQFFEREYKVLDVRSPDMAEQFIQIYGDRWLNIPLSTIPQKIDEIPSQEPLFVFCNTGATAYEVQRYLNNKGIDKARTVQGSYALMREIAPEFLSSESS